MVRTRWYYLFCSNIRICGLVSGCFWILSSVCGSLQSVDKVGIFIYFWVGFLRVLLSCFGLRAFYRQICAAPSFLCVVSLPKFESSPGIPAGFLDPCLICCFSTGGNLPSLFNQNLPFLPLTCVSKEMAQFLKLNLICSCSRRSTTDRSLAAPLP